MSWTSDAYPKQSTYKVLDRRTVAEVQKKVIKQSGQDPFSRQFYEKDDKDTIVAWKLDLNGILHIFNVCSV